LLAQDSMVVDSTPHLSFKAAQQELACRSLQSHAKRPGEIRARSRHGLLRVCRAELASLLARQTCTPSLGRSSAFYALELCYTHVQQWNQLMSVVHRRFTTAALANFSTKEGSQDPLTWGGSAFLWMRLSSGEASALAARRAGASRWRRPLRGLGDALREGRCLHCGSLLLRGSALSAPTST